MTSLALRGSRRLRRAIRSTDIGRSLDRRVRRAGVRNQSRFDNVYHCCTQKTASQWIRGILDDSKVYRRCGLEMVPYRHLGLRFADIRGPFPARTIAAHLYVDYETYADIPKPADYRTFFVLRDPRDCVVSWYFSAAYSHRPAEGVDELRPELQRLSRRDGFRYLIDRLADWGSFSAQRSWVEHEPSDPNVRLFRYETLATNPSTFVNELFDWLEIELPATVLDRLLERHSFAAHAHDRQQGVEDIGSHYRKGVAGDWRAYFDGDTIGHFHSVTGDLLTVLGYEE